jgi:hypothetical protein
MLVQEMWVPCGWLRGADGTPNYTITKTCCSEPTDEQRTKVVQMFCDKAGCKTAEELKSLVS